MSILHRNTASGGAVTNPAASAETVIYTTPAVQAGAGVGAVGISGTVNITPGTSTTAIIIRIRQGSLTGALVGVSPSHTVAAAAPQSISYGAADTSSFIEQSGGGVYVVTAQQTGGTVAGTTNSVDIEVID